MGISGPRHNLLIKLFYFSDHVNFIQKFQQCVSFRKSAKYQSIILEQEPAVLGTFKVFSKQHLQHKERRFLRFFRKYLQIVNIQHNTCAYGKYLNMFKNSFRKKLFAFIEFSYSSCHNEVFFSIFKMTKTKFKNILFLYLFILFSRAK